MSRIISFLLSIIMCLMSFFGIDFRCKPKLEKIFDYVYDLGTYTSYDVKAADDYFADEYDDWGGKCTAVEKTLDDGTVLVGRNMDLNISNKAAYVYRTKIRNCYETINLTYTFRDISPDNDLIEKEGITDEFRNLIPFMADDVLNSQGLYIEINMREGEFFADGTAKYSCSGTNPDSDKRIYMFQVPRYVGEHCATVKEAVEYIKSLNIYSKNGYWNYAFLMADATGNYGVVELAQNKVLWHQGQQAQTNFYIDKEMNAIEEYKTGVGRYDAVMAGVGSVKTEKDMYELMKTVNYYSVYTPDTCKFDYRSECVGHGVTYDMVMDPANQEYLKQQVKEQGAYVTSLSRQEQQNKNEYWESSFTEVINCTEKTLFVRFFENEEKTMTLDFNKGCCWFK